MQKKFGIQRPGYPGIAPTQTHQPTPSPSSSQTNPDEGNGRSERNRRYEMESELGADEERERILRPLRGPLIFRTAALRYLKIGAFKTAVVIEKYESHVVLDIGISEKKCILQTQGFRWPREPIQIGQFVDVIVKGIRGDEIWFKPAPKNAEPPNPFI